MGSARPHAPDGGADAPPEVVWRAGSLRQLEPERLEVLAVEPLPDTNSCIETWPDEEEEPTAEELAAAAAAAGGKDAKKEDKGKRGRDAKS